MTRPQIIRADTIDLQNPQSPSAQDHTKQPYHPAPAGSGHPSSHQAETLRHVAEEQNLEQHQTSPRISQEWVDELGIQDQSQSRYTDYSHEDHQAHYDSGHYHAGQYYGHGHGGFEESPDYEDMTDAMVDEDGDDILDDEMMDKISSSPSIDDEDIDFEFVYALHTFVATVEGQANATKGDTMVLLDDSNSYWWLVRVVKDGSIGYLPAEHIETPTERLARLNKHRNIDLSQTMLSDTHEKSKNPLKKAMRRRNAKTVIFTDPTYVEASDIDYSSTDEEDVVGRVEYGIEEDSGDASQEYRDSKDDSVTVQPLKVRGPERASAESENVLSTTVSQASAQSSAEDQVADFRASDEIASREGDPSASVSRNGIVRNTDSFFKDDNVETRKITLTPNLLRDDSTYANSKPKTGPDALENLASAPEKPKEDRRKKEKKSGVLSGLFKRKEKKARGHDDEGDDIEHNSSEFVRESPQPKSSEESSMADLATPKPMLQQQPPQAQRQPGKLQKSPPSREQHSLRNPGSKSSSRQQNNGADKEGHVGNSITPSMRLVEPEPDQPSLEQPAPLKIRSQDQRKQDQPAQVFDQDKASHEDEALSLSDPNSSIQFHKRSESNQPNLEVAIDNEPTSANLTKASESDAIVLTPASASAESARPLQKERLSESPVEVSPLDEDVSMEPPHLVVDTSSQEDHTTTLISPSSPEQHEPRNSKMSEDTPISAASSLATAAPWSDASLKAYFDDDRNVRDLLLVVHDNTGVEPAGPDHPMLQGLFGEERQKLAEMNRKLDSMLHEWLSKRPHITAT